MRPLSQKHRVKAKALQRGKLYVVNSLAAWGNAIYLGPVGSLRWGDVVQST
jgi:hypothetical protein